MSNQIPTWMVQAYARNVHVLSQQKGSRLARTVRIDGDIVGERVHYDRVGQAAAQRVTTRHGDTPIMNTPHSRRSAVMFDYDWGDLVDKPDKLKTINDPTNSYQMAAMWALGRSTDDEIIDAMFGNASAGKTGATLVALPAAQKIAVDDHTYDAGAGDVGLTVSKLILAREILTAAEVDEDLPMYCVTTAKQISNMLATTEVTSADFNSVKALVQGTFNTFMGFEFVRTQRLTLDANSNRQVGCYTGMTIGLGVPQETIVDIGPRRDKRNATQVYASKSIGAVRIEDAQMVEVACKE